MNTIHYGAEPLVTIWADSAPGFARAAAAVAAAGCRIGGEYRIADAVRHMGQLPSADAVLVDAVADAGEPFDRLLDRLESEAEAGRFDSVVALTPELIDIAAARTPHGSVALLCQPLELEVVAALRLALHARSDALFEERGDDSPGQLRKLSEEVGRIARALAAMSGGEPRPASRPVLPSSDQPAAVELPAVAAIRAALRTRRLRDRYFDAELFADPAWDMLLDLTLARIEQRSVAVSSLCIAAAVPPTTALRWIKRLTDEGVFIRVADPRDGRRVFIELSDKAADAMSAYFHAAARMGSG